MRRSKAGRTPPPARQQPRAGRRCLRARALERGRRSSGFLRRPGEVLEVERVATTLFVERGGSCRLDVLPEELVCLEPGQRAELDPDETAGAVCVLERGRQPLRNLRGDAWRGPWRPAAAVAVAVRPAVRPRPNPPSEDRRARAGAAGPPWQAVQAAPGPRGSSCSARAETRAAGRREPGERREDVASSVRTSSSSEASDPRIEACAYSSSASTKTQKGRSRSSSDADPASTRWPRASARAASSARRRVLPMPGSPTRANRREPRRHRARRGAGRTRRAPRRARRGARQRTPSCRQKRG